MENRSLDYENYMVIIFKLFFLLGFGEIGYIIVVIFRDGFEIRFEFFSFR